MKVEVARPFDDQRVSFNFKEREKNVNVLREEETFLSNNDENETNYFYGRENFGGRLERTVEWSKL